LNVFSQSLSAEKIYEKVKDAVVVIYAYDYNDDLAKQGSGVVLNDKNYVVTNYHVLSGCERLEIMHGKEIIPYVDIIGIDVEKDILILKIEGKKFPSIKVGDVKTLKVGQRVYAIGNPMGFENTISEGIIGGLRSYNEFRKNYIQITASISPGSSGGAVLNDKGELIGISTLTVRDGQNLNFAIPIDEVMSVEIGSYSKENAFKDFELFEEGFNAAENGNYYDAIKYYSKFIELYPNDAEPYNNRGIAKGKLEDYLGSIQDFNKAIEINLNDARVYINRGIAKSSLEDYGGAIQDYTKAIEINSNDAEVYTYRGIAKQFLEDYWGAIKDFNKAIEISPNDAGEAGAYYYCGVAKHYLEDYEGAIQDYTIAIEIKPNDYLAYRNRGFVKSNLEDYSGAIRDYTMALKINPNDSRAYFSRGLAKFELGDKIGACLDWSKAGELGDSYAYDLIKQYCN
jgi:tetratricopeptide (TPR) repeat protein